MNGDLRLLRNIANEINSVVPEYVKCNIMISRYIKLAGVNTVFSKHHLTTHWSSRSNILKNKPPPDAAPISSRHRGELKKGPL